MKIHSVDPPRKFRVGKTCVEISDCARIDLDADEQVTFCTPQGGEYDVARKAWGFYATPSLDSRLPGFGLRPALIKNSQGRHYVLLCEAKSERAFQQYVDGEELTVVCWLDDPAVLNCIETATSGAAP